ncbi:histidine kinase [Nonomuraea basaltis]|uniref:histidine kinase n=1 Tax=Nonomuraea basaltis TaxID=2495887 RepID=UPI00110C45C7|nr:histidine kinase [Nonomuraea basaltis]
MHRTGFSQAHPRETGPAGHVNAPAQALQNPVEDDYRITADLHDILVNQIFAVSLDLHAALSLTGDAQAKVRITRAIRGLDHAITDLRRTLFELAQHTSPPDHEHIASVPEATT